MRCMPGLLLDLDPRHCRAVLASLCQCAPARDVLAFLDDMGRWGVSPGRSDHHAVLDVLLREGMAAEAYEVVARQMDADGVAQGLPEFERVLRAFREKGSFDAVVEAFDDMLLRGIVPRGLAGARRGYRSGRRRDADILAVGRLTTKLVLHCYMQ
ncbi:hypothetical protein SETIT_8G016600v2 [Setaria italica]|uniref:Pentacotripeptide-repeat region of PRORP domain-containing protein n=1 Tax=Setaria italica TaxID=4555 RepID=K3ZK42_SETIT|nr:hypothetical protein SETIT_8G016600v2 [Setaria italica]